MLLDEDGGLTGSVGGGPKEAEVIEAARDLMRRGGARRLTLDFSTGLSDGDGPVCGGVMEVFMERIDARRVCHIAGAGHVAYALHRFLALLEFRTCILDPREDFNTEDRFPGAERRLVPFESCLEGLVPGESDAVVILTPEHRHDAVVLKQALATHAGYVGMIGSRRKVATLFKALEAEGVPRESLGRVHAPVGLDIGAETPAEIALAIAAELVQSWRSPASRIRRGETYL